MREGITTLIFVNLLEMSGFEMPLAYGPVIRPLLAAGHKMIYKSNRSQWLQNDLNQNQPPMI